MEVSYYSYVHRSYDTKQKYYEILMIYRQKTILSITQQYFLTRPMRYIKSRGQMNKEINIYLMKLHSFFIYNEHHCLDQATKPIGPWWWPMASQNFVNIGWGNGLVLSSTKPLPKSISNDHKCSPMASIFHNHCSRHNFLWVWNVTFHWILQAVS